MDGVSTAAMIGGTDGGTATWKNGLGVLKGAAPFATANCPALGTCCKTLTDMVGFLEPSTDTEEGKTRVPDKRVCMGCDDVKNIIAGVKAGATLQLAQPPFIYEIEALVRVDLPPWLQRKWYLAMWCFLLHFSVCLAVH